MSTKAAQAAARAARIVDMQRAATKAASKQPRVPASARVDAPPAPDMPPLDIVVTDAPLSQSELSNLAQSIYQITTPDRLEGVHPASIARASADLKRAAAAGQLSEVGQLLNGGFSKAGDRGGYDRLRQFLDMSVDPVMDQHNRNIARNARFQEALARAGTSPAPSKPRGDADSRLREARLAADLIDDDSAEQLAQAFNALPDDARLRIAQNINFNPDMQGTRIVSMNSLEMGPGNAVLDPKRLAEFAASEPGVVDSFRRALKDELMGQMGAASDRAAIVSAGRPAMRPQETPLSQRLTMRPGEAPGKRADAAAEARELALDKERFAAGGPVLTSRESVAAQTGVDDVRRQVLGLKPDQGRPRQPLEPRANFDRPVQRGEELHIREWYARKELQEALAAGDDAAADVARKQLTAMGKDPNAKFNFNRQIRPLTDRKLNSSGPQQTYDEHLQVVAGERTKPQHGLNRSNNLDAEEADVEAANLAEAAGMQEANAQGLSDAEDLAGWRAGDLAEHRQYAGKRPRLGGARPVSRQLDAIDRLFTSRDRASQTTRVVNPFDLEEFSADPSDLAKMVMANRYRNFDYDTDLGNLTTQIAEEQAKYGGSPTAIAESLLRANTFYKPGTAAWDMAHDQISNALVRRFGGRTKSADSVASPQIDLASIPVPAPEGIQASTARARRSAAAAAQRNNPAVIDNLEASSIPLDEIEVPASGNRKPRGGSRRAGPAGGEEIDLAAIAPDGAEVIDAPDLPGVQGATARARSRAARAARTATPTQEIDLEQIEAPATASGAGGGGDADKPPSPTTASAASYVQPESAPGVQGATARARQRAARAAQAEPVTSQSRQADGAKGNVTSASPAPEPPARKRISPFLIGAGLVAAGAGGLALNSATRPRGLSPLSPGMGGGTDGAGTVTPDVSSQVATPPEHGAGQMTAGAMTAAEQEAALHIMNRIRGGTLGRMPMLQTFQEYH